MATKRGVIQTLFESRVGKLGVAWFTALVIGAVFAVVWLPADFGPSVWNNPAYWADNPKTAEPIWTVWLNPDKTRHQVFSSFSPDKVVEHEYGKTVDYRFDVAFSDVSDPIFLTFSVANVEFQDESPEIRVFIETDGMQIPIYRDVVRGRRANEEAPVQRFSTQPLRVQLSSDYAVANTLRNIYSGLRERGENSFTAVVRIDFSDAADSVREVRFIAGGEVFGWLGTDNVGRDIATGILAGLPAALFIGLVVAFPVTLIGALVGAVSAYFGGKVDTLLQRVIDVLTMVPALPIIIFLIFAFGAKLYYVVMFLITFYWTAPAIQTRPLFMQIRAEGFISLAQARGYSSARIIWRHLLPQIMPYLFASFIFAMPSAILAEAGLSFLGLGDPSLPTWGQMLQSGFNTGAIMLGYWWWVLAPGLAIVFTAMAPALISVALEEYSEPRLKRVQERR